MKKVILTIGLVGMLAVAGYLVVSTNIVINMGADKYYVKTTSNYTTNDSGDFKLYTYKLNGYNKDGNEKTLEFNSSKVLKENRYLKVYEKDDEVKSFEEVKLDEVPNNARNKLK